MKNRTFYSALHAAQTAHASCVKRGSTEWAEKWANYSARLCAEYLPSGSGIDCGTALESVTPNSLTFALGFHHMNEDGYYTHWTEHRVIVTPTFDGFAIRITGRNHNQIKDYLGEIFAELATVTAPNVGDI